jgi:hypothetical protein
MLRGEAVFPGLLFKLFEFLKLGVKFLDSLSSIIFEASEYLRLICWI